MIKRLTVITLLVYVLFIIEILLHDIFGLWAKPQLLVLLIVFWGLYSGIRYSIFAAFLSGLVKDSVSISPFGTYLFLFIAAAFLTTLIRQNLYQPGSRFSRAVVSLFVLLGVFVLQTMLYLMNHEIPWQDLFVNIFLPELITSMVVVTYVFHRLRDITLLFKV
jgi:rod shape-determining protein MreD